MRTLGKGVKTRGSRVVGKGLFDVLSGKTTLDFGKLMDKGSADLRRLQTGKGFTDEIERYFDSDEVKAERKKKKEDEWNARMADIKKNSPFPRNEELEKLLGYGIVGELFGDLAIEGGKKLYNFDKQHGSHLKEGVKSGLKNMVSNFFTGGRGIESATRFGRGFYPDMAYLDVMPEMIYPAVLPDVMEGKGLLDNLRKDKRFSSLPNDDVSGWIEKERRSTGYYDRPAILGEGM